MENSQHHINIYLVKVVTFSILLSISFNFFFWSAACNVRHSRSQLHLFMVLYSDFICSCYSHFTFLFFLILRCDAACLPAPLLTDGRGSGFVFLFYFFCAKKTVCCRSFQIVPSRKIPSTSKRAASCYTAAISAFWLLLFFFSLFFLLQSFWVHNLQSDQF